MIERRFNQLAADLGKAPKTPEPGLFFDRQNGGTHASQEDCATRFLSGEPLCPVPNPEVLASNSRAKMRWLRIPFEMNSNILTHFQMLPECVNLLFKPFLAAHPLPSGVGWEKG